MKTFPPSLQRKRVISMQCIAFCSLCTALIFSSCQMLCNSSVSEQYVSITPHPAQESYQHIAQKLQSEAAYLVLETRSEGMIGNPELRLKRKVTRSAEWEDTLNKWAKCHNWVTVKEKLQPAPTYIILDQYSFYNKEGDLLLRIPFNSKISTNPEWTHWGYTDRDCVRHIVDDITQWESIEKALKSMSNTHAEAD